MNNINGLNNGLNNNDMRGNRSILNNITSMFSKTKIKFTRRSYNAFILCSFIFILSLSFLFINSKFNLGIFANVITGTIDGITDGEITYTYDEQTDVLTLSGYGTLQDKITGPIWYDTTLGFGRDVKSIHIVGDSETNMIKLPEDSSSLFWGEQIDGINYLDNLKELTFTNVDVTNVTDTSYMFSCIHLDNLDLSKDSIGTAFSSDTNMMCMFDDFSCEYLDMSSAIASVEDVRWMFYEAEIDTINLSGCDFSNVTDAEKAFKDSYIERIMLPCAVSDSYDIELFVDSDRSDDYDWLGVDNNGTIVYNHDYCAAYYTLPQKDGALEEIRLINFDYDMYNNELYYSGDLQYFWDLSENGDMSQLVAYYKDYDDLTKYDGGELVILDTTQNDETDYLMGFDGYFYKDSSGNVTNSNGEDMTNFSSCDLTSNSGDEFTYDDSVYTPWSYMNATTDDKVHKVTIANKINTYSSMYYFAGLDELREVNLTEMTYNASLQNNDHFAYKMFERDDNFTIKFSGNIALMGQMLYGAGNNVIVDLRGSDLYYANVRSYVSNLYFPLERVYIPDHMTAAKTNFSWYFPSTITDYVAYYNDDDEFIGFSYNLLARDETIDTFGRVATYFIGAPEMVLVNEYNKFADVYNIGDDAFDAARTYSYSSYDTIASYLKRGMFKNYLTDDDMITAFIKSEDSESFFSNDIYATSSYHNEYALAYVFEKRFNEGKDKQVDLNDSDDVKSCINDLFEYFDKLMHPEVEVVNPRSIKTNNGIKEYIFNYKDNINIKIKNPVSISDPDFINTYFIYEDKWDIANAIYNHDDWTRPGELIDRYRDYRYSKAGPSTCDEKWEDDDYYYFKYIVDRYDSAFSVAAHLITDANVPDGCYSYLNDVEFQLEILEDIGLGDNDKICEITTEYDKDYLIYDIYGWLFDEDGKYTLKLPFYHYDLTDDQQDLRFSNNAIENGKLGVTIKIPKKVKVLLEKNYTMGEKEDIQTVNVEELKRYDLPTLEEEFQYWIDNPYVNGSYVSKYLDAFWITDNYIVLKNPKMYTTSSIYFNTNTDIDYTFYYKGPAQEVYLGTDELYQDHYLNIPNDYVDEDLTFDSDSDVESKLTKYDAHVIYETDPSWDTYMYFDDVDPDDTHDKYLAIKKEVLGSYFTRIDDTEFNFVPDKAGTHEYKLQFNRSYDSVLIGTDPIKVTVNKLDIAKNNNSIQVKNVKNKLYTGSAITIDDLEVVYVNNDGDEIPLDKDIDYEIIYSNNKELGKAKATIKAKGDSITGSRDVYFKIVKTEAELDDPVDDEPNGGNGGKDKPTSITTATITVGGSASLSVPNGYVKGYDDNTFKPNKGITRAEFAKIMAETSGNFSSSDITNLNNLSGYNDVDSTKWYASYIGYLAKCKVIAGYADNTFRPNDEITRAEVCKIISNMYNMNEVKNVDSFNSELSNKWYEPFCKKLINAGYMNGYPDGTFKPNNKITRAEVISIINKVKGYSNKTISDNEKQIVTNTYKDLPTSEWYFNDICIALFNK